MDITPLTSTTSIDPWASDREVAKMDARERQIEANRLHEAAEARIALAQEQRHADLFAIMDEVFA